MNELPLSKFAPFTKLEASFQWDAQNKLNDLNINCNNCIYFQNQEENKLEGFFECGILSCEDKLIKENSFCKFFTAKSDIEKNNKTKDLNPPDQEMSTAIQKLDFSNSNVYNIIKELRESFINE